MQQNDVGMPQPKQKTILELYSSALIGDRRFSCKSKFKKAFLNYDINEKQ
jgi:hypothetical protein